MILPQSPPWLDSTRQTGSTTNTTSTIDSASIPSSATSASSSMTARHPLNGQLSPVSTGVDIPVGAATDDNACPSHAGPMTAQPMSRSQSSVADSWSLIYGDVPDDGRVTHVIVDHDTQWEHVSDEGLPVPKVEPTEEDVRLEEIKEAPLTPGASNTSPTTAQPKAKRPRGRPRKHPLAPATAANKVTKGRSKTGCLTCRKRKKKCDEAKPRCTFRSRCGLCSPCYLRPRLTSTTVSRYELRKKCCCLRRVSRKANMEERQGKSSRRYNVPGSITKPTLGH